MIEAIGATPSATAAIWRYLLDVDWVATVKASLLPLDHPLFLLLVEPRRMQFTVADSLWVRPIDVGAALSGRSYSGEGEIVFEVSDAFCPWNEGRWRLEGGHTERTQKAPDLRLGAAELGSVLLGGVPFGQLERARRVEVLRPGAVARADALFRAERLPWCLEIF